MIDLSSIYSRQRLDEITKEWYDDVVRFLTEKHEGKNSLYIKEGHDRKTFKTQRGKGAYLIKKTAGYAVLSANDKKYIGLLFKEIVECPDRYITADEKRLKEVAVIELKNHPAVVNIVKDVFVKWYNDFTGKEEISYKYMDKLNIRTCPYCNRNYTFIIKRTKEDTFKTRPEFDHFYDRSDYPPLALSFFNLVPSCHTCNHGKLTREAGLNPYFSGFNTRFRICHPEKDLEREQKDFRPMNINEVLAVKNADNFSIALPKADSKEETNIKLFGLTQLYNKHKDYVLEIIDKANAYNAIGAENIIDAFQGIGRSPQDVYDFVWGRYLDDKGTINLPLAKLTADVLNQLRIK